MSKARFLWIIFFTALTVGCSSIKPHEGMYVAIEKVFDENLRAEQTSQVRIYRDDAMIQKFASLSISINGSQVATLGNDSAKAIKIKPGKHRIESRLGALDGKSGCGFDFQSSEGEVIYFVAGPSGAGAALPIVSLLANPVTCKFNISPVAPEDKEVIEKINSKI